jgi:hypothetical protein
MRMQGKAAAEAGYADTTADVDAVAAAAPPLAQLAAVARAGRLEAADTLRLQRMVGNRAVTRILARYEDEEQRAMLDKGGQTDESTRTETGHRWVWDPFDHTVTIFMPADGPNPNGAVQLVYREGTPEANAALPNLGLESAEGLSPVRAEVLEFLRVQQGTYQETESQRKARVKAKSGTLCYAFTSSVVSMLNKDVKGFKGMDPREGAIKGGRGGAFHTLDDRPGGPKPGDIISYGVIHEKPGGGRRFANFEERSHIGVFKSKRKPKSGSGWIWTVVDGGQGTYESLQEIRERTRKFTTESLDIQIPKAFYTADEKQGDILVHARGSVKYVERDTVEKTCGVLKSKLADAGQSPEDKLLRGWLDIDEMFGSGPAPDPSAQGVNNIIFVGGESARKSAEAAGNVIAKPAPLST